MALGFGHRDGGEGRGRQAARQLRHRARPAPTTDLVNRTNTAHQEAVVADIGFGVAVAGGCRHDVPLLRTAPRYGLPVEFHYRLRCTSHGRRRLLRARILLMRATRPQRRPARSVATAVAAGWLALVIGSGGCEVAVGDTVPAFACEQGAGDTCPATRSATRRRTSAFACRRTAAAAACATARLRRWGPRSR